MSINEDRLPLRISALLLLNMGESRSDVSRYLGISRVTLVAWSRRFEQGGWSGLLSENRGRRASGRGRGYQTEPATPVAVKRQPTRRRRP